MGEIVRTLMRRLQRIAPGSADGERPAAVAVIRAIEGAKDLAAAGPLRRAVRAARTGRRWPVAPGAYVVGDPAAPVAVCTLTSTELIGPLATLPGVAITGRIYTPNLGVERIIRNVTANPHVRFLLVCGAESPVFRPAQAIRALVQHGVAPDGRIIGADGPMPVVRALPAAHIEAFRQHIELVDRAGTLDVDALAAVIAELARRTPQIRSTAGARPAAPPTATTDEPPPESIAVLRPGGRRRPLTYDPTGFFIVTLDRSAGEIVCRHHRADYTPAHEMRGRNAEAMLLGLIEAGLITQLSHAGYLGSELTKAETALRLGMPYEQDRPLRGGRGMG